MIVSYCRSSIALLSMVVTVPATSLNAFPSFIIWTSWSGPETMSMTSFWSIFAKKIRTFCWSDCSRDNFVSTYISGSAMDNACKISTMTDPMRYQVRSCSFRWSASSIARSKLSWLCSTQAARIFDRVSFSLARMSSNSRASSSRRKRTPLCSALKFWTTNSTSARPSLSRALIASSTRASMPRISAMKRRFRFMIPAAFSRTGVKNSYFSHVLTHRAYAFSSILCTAMFKRPINDIIF